MRNLVVDNIMSVPVFSVDENDLVKTAVDKMKKAGTKKILVKSNDKPIGVLYFCRTMKRYRLLSINTSYSDW